MSNVLHSSESPEWYTPSQYVESARKILGEIDLDPASCEQAQKVVRARHWFSKADDGLSKIWTGRIFLNPPYGRGDICGRWVRKLLGEPFTAAIVLTYSNTSTRWGQQLLKQGVATCFTDHRIEFDSPDGKGVRPPKGNMFTFLLAEEFTLEDMTLFREAFCLEFGQYGQVF